MDNLNRLSLVAANYGNGNSFGDVLNDWIAFLGKRPDEVLIIDGGSDQATQQVYWTLFTQGKIDKLQVIQPSHPDNHKDKCVIQEYYAGAQATNPYVLFFKIDTLPYRKGHDDWLAEAIKLLDRPEVFSVSGSFNYDSRYKPAWDGWYYTKKCSLNFALMKRETYMDALHEFAGEYIKSGFTRGNPLAGKPDERFVMERALEAYMERHNLLTLAREEDETWTIAHTNLVGEKLSKARDSYLRREGIATYIRRQSSSKEPFAVYYGAPRLPLIKRIRWAVGDSVLGPPWRAVKALFSRPSRATP